MITLPLPPTDNRLRMPVRNRLIKTSVYRKWEEKASFLYKSKIKLEPSYTNQIKIPYKLFLPNKRSDISNYEKALKDFLTGRLYEDDKWVCLDLIIPVVIDKKRPRVEIIV